MFFSMSQSIHSYTFHVVILPVVTPSKMRYKMFASKCARVNFKIPFEKFCDVPEGVVDMDKWAVNALAQFWADEIKSPSSKWTFLHRNASEARAAYDAVYLHHRDVVLGLGPAICVHSGPQPRQHFPSISGRISLFPPLMPYFVGSYPPLIHPSNVCVVSKTTQQHPSGVSVSEERSNVAFNTLTPKVAEVAVSSAIDTPTSGEKEHDEIWGDIGSEAFLESLGPSIDTPVAIPDVSYDDLGNIHDGGPSDKTATSGKRKRVRSTESQRKKRDEGISSKFISFS